MKKTKLIALTMVVALMMVGAGYAAWSDTLHFEQTVNTGHLDVKFVDITDEITLLDAYMDKGVSYSEEYLENGAKDNNNAWDVAEYTIKNAYPGASYSIKVQMENKSTMPVRLTDIGLNGDELGAEIVEWAPFVYYVDENIQVNNLSTFKAFVNGVQVDVEEVLEDEYLELPINGVLELQAKLTTPDNALEDHDYTFQIHPKFVQFNDPKFN